jgi:hypothetical protein
MSTSFTTEQQLLTHLNSGINSSIIDQYNISEMTTINQWITSFFSEYSGIPEAELKSKIKSYYVNITDWSF